MFIVIGTATVDLFLSNLTDMPRSEGDEFTVDSLVFHDDPLRFALGGNGANSAYALARLGASVDLIAALGTDQLGDWMARLLADAGVSMGGVRQIAGWSTSTTLILSAAQRNRTAFHHAGANRFVNGNAIDEDLVRRAEMLLLTGYTILPGLRPHGAVALFQKAQRGGTRTAVDIGPAIGEPGRLAELRPLLAHTDYFLCNEYELQVCTGETDIVAGMTAILEGSADCAVIKRGAAGAAIMQREDGEAGARLYGEPVDAPGFVVQAHGAVGAGDCFDAGFLLAVQEGASPQEAARFANACAAIVVSTPERPLDALSRASVCRFRNSSPGS